MGGGSKCFFDSERRSGPRLAYASEPFTDSLLASPNFPGECPLATGHADQALNFWIHVPPYVKSLFVLNYFYLTPLVVFWSTTI